MPKNAMLCASLLYFHADYINAPTNPPHSFAVMISCSSDWFLATDKRHASAALSEWPRLQLGAAAGFTQLFEGVAIVLMHLLLWNVGWHMLFTPGVTCHDRKICSYIKSSCLHACGWISSVGVAQNQEKTWRQTEWSWGEERRGNSQCRYWGEREGNWQQKKGERERALLNSQ